MGDSDTRNSDRPARRKRRRRNKNRSKSYSGGSGGGNNSSGGGAAYSQGPQEPYREMSLAEATGKVEPFELFGTYYLGLTPDDRYRLARGRDVARRLSTSVSAVEILLQHYGMGEAAVKQSGFELDMARLDMEKVPEGISRREVARQLYEEFCDIAGLTPGAVVVAMEELVEPEPEAVAEPEAALIDEPVDDGDDADEADA